MLRVRVCQDERCECGYISLGVDAMTAILRYLAHSSPYHNKGTEEICVLHCYWLWSTYSIP